MSPRARVVHVGGCGGTCASVARRRHAIEADVFDLLFALVHPGTYPGGTGWVGWLDKVLGVDATTLAARWAAFEPMLESVRLPEDFPNPYF